MILKRSDGVPFCWSSDKKWLILQQPWDNPYLYAFELDKKFELTLPEHVGTFVSFSPEGNKMLFYRSSHDAKWPLKIVSSSGGASYKPAGNTAAYGSTWMGDSKQIMIQGEDEQGNIGMKIISLGEEDPMNIKIEADVDGEPFPYYMLPDNKHIAFSVKKDNGLQDLYVAPFSVKEAKTTGSARKIFKDWSGGAYNATTSWSPDGKKLAMTHEGNIWMVPLDTGIPVQITDTPEEERWINWSPDGQWISYKTFNQAKKTETLHVIKPGADSSLILHRNCYRETVWKHDNKGILIFSDGVLQEISLDGILQEKILSLQDLEIEVFESPCLSPDGKHFAFVGYESYESGERSMIIKYSFDSKKVTKLALEDGQDYKYSISWSPDGKWIAYLTYEEIKVRPEGYLWEADFDEVIEKLASEH
jgi:WD40 repeat protein